MKSRSKSKDKVVDSIHKLTSHDIAPRIKKKKKKDKSHKKNASLNKTDMERKFGIKLDNILPKEGNMPYSMRKKERMDYTPPNRLRKKEDLVVEENLTTNEPLKEEEETSIEEEEENEIMEFENPVELIVNNILANLKNIPLLNELDAHNLEVFEEKLGEGQYGIVKKGTYNGITVACKVKRKFTLRERSFLQSYRELEFASKLTLCRYINRYIGWVYCNKIEVENPPPRKRQGNFMQLYVIQPYIENADARSYLSKREKKFQPNEVLQASICLFSALTDAHTLDIGIVDLKLENFLIDRCGSGWLTDFGSCIELNSDVVSLDAEEVHWTKSVAAPEMIRHKQFLKSSDVFMGTLIIAELMTADLNDEEFAAKVLNRKINGDVSFSHDLIDKGFKKFFKLLQAGLSNDPSERPDANTMLESLLKMK